MTNHCEPLDMTIRYWLLAVSEIIEAEPSIVLPPVVAIFTLLVPATLLMTYIRPEFPVAVGRVMLTRISWMANEKLIRSGVNIEGKHHGTGEK